MKRMMTPYVRRSLWGACAALALGVVPASATPLDHSSATTFNGETLLRGIFFDVGPVAERLAIRRGASRMGPNRAFSQSTFERAEAAIRREDPSFFLRFSVELQSHDPMRVTHSLAEAEGFIKRAMATLYSKGNANAAGHPDALVVTDPVCVIVICGSPMSQPIWVLGNSNSAGGSRLQRERLAALIADMF